MKCKLLDGKYYRTEDGRQVVYEAGAVLDLADWEYEAFSNKFQPVEVVEVPAVNIPPSEGDKGPAAGGQGEGGQGEGGENNPDTGTGGQGESDNLPDGGQVDSTNQEANQDAGQGSEQGPTQGPDQETAEPCPGLKHIGGGVYELPNGTRVRGRENAEAALVELTKQKE